MGHASVANETPFAFEQLFLMDEEGRPVLVTLVQASFDLTRRGPVQSEPQSAIPLAGERWPQAAAASGSVDPPRWEDDVAGYRIEPPFAFTKPGTDVVLVGHAVARRRAPETTVSLLCGRLARTVVVRGDRVWVESAGSVTPSAPAPFDRIPLSYERAFGGWDRSDPAAPVPFRPNPLGQGYARSADAPWQQMRLPNIEDPADPLLYLGQVVAPAGLGFVPVQSELRTRYGGTYDAAWQRDRMPLLPADFDRRFFNAASPGLTAAAYLRGDEPVRVSGATFDGELAFVLPGLAPPRCRVEIHRRPDAHVDMVLDTVIIDTDRDQLLLWFRGHTPLFDGPHDVRTIEIR